jgi:hypothetical protein
MHTCLPPVTFIRDYWTHQDSTTCLITSPIFVISPALFNAAALMFVCRYVTRVLTLFLSCYLSVPHKLFNSPYLLFISSVGPFSRPDHEMLTYKPFTNSAVQEELRKYLPN